MTSKIVFSFKENYADVAVVSKFLGKVNIKKVFRIEDQPYASEYNLNEIKNIREKYRTNSNKVYLVLNWDNLITRIVDTPIMSKSELKSFVKNNIEEYFAVNMDEYYYNYEVISIDKQQDENKKMSIMLAVVQKDKLKQISQFIKYCGLQPMSIGIYPDYIANLFIDKLDNSKIILDVNSGRSTLTILDEDRIFLYSNISNQDYSKDEENFDDILENLDYFLNFYSTRHFGDKIDKIYVLGEFYNNHKLYKHIKEHTNTEIISGLEDKKSKIIKHSTVDGKLYPDILGCFIDVKNIYNKYIDFLDDLNSESNKKQYQNKIIIIEFLILFLITIIIPVSTLFYVKFSMPKYDTSDMNAQISSLSWVQSEIDKLDDEKAEYDNKIENIKKIENDEFNYVKIFDTIRRGIPNNVSVKYVSVDKSDVYVVFGVKNNTLDAARIVVALNKMHIFKPVELPNVYLNNTVEEVILNLKISDSYKGVNTNEKK
ncbi:hypothetical protein KM800_10675 [Clostridium tyrobutyricum]|uniref:hypothetical protein n=1 Tax=Clostridium tyrobutyricum TaxID=1519 RepID=UPI001C384C4D|nr:hypothetical protein [Clostridium tyrobutyricum]MBV4419779.1 hypothetical protein [Clostridium tyrobutyricum]